MDVKKQPSNNIKIKHNEGLNLCESILKFASILLMILTFPLSLIPAIKVVMEYQRVIIFRLGRVLNQKPSGPGLFFILPCIDSINVVDMRTQSFDIPPQEILTKDSVTVNIDAVVFFHVDDPQLSVLKVVDVLKSTKLLASSILRNVLGMYSLTEILRDKVSISREISNQLDEITDLWGVKVENMEMKDILIPKDMRRSMAAEAEAIRNANAKIIAAKGEKDASASLRDASEIISESPVALQLRYLQSLTAVAAENNSTIIFPIPLEFSKLFK